MNHNQKINFLVYSAHIFSKCQIVMHLTAQFNPMNRNNVPLTNTPPPPHFTLFTAITQVDFAINKIKIERLIYYLPIRQRVGKFGGLYQIFRYL